MTRSTREKLGLMLARLWLHYPSQDMDRDHWRMLTEDYLDTLQGYPLEAIEMGIQVGLRKWKFRPTIAEIVTESRPFIPRVVVQERRIKAIAPPTPEQVQRRLARLATMPEGPLKRALTGIAQGRSKGINFDGSDGG